MKVVCLSYKNEIENALNPQLKYLGLPWLMAS